MRDEKEDITTNANEIEKTISGYFKNVYSNKLENLQEMNR
jgi:hypothetical protein